jgi:hypothetical protein
MTNTESHFQMYRGALALFWVDGKFTQEEIDRFLELVERSINLTESQKAMLASDIREHVSVATVWPLVTDAMDRAHLINIANMLFWQDGAFCHAEREVIVRLEKEHLSTLKTDELEKDLADMAQNARALWKEEEKQMVDSMMPHTRFFYYLEKKITSLF